MMLHSSAESGTIISSYQIKIFRPDCNPNFQSVHCIAHLDKDIREVLPYLNTVLGGSTYTDDPPSVTFKNHGKLITVHSQQIAINALILEILKLLPRNDCRQCGQTTCMVFSLLVADGVKGPEDCPGLIDPYRTNLQKYLEQFPLES